MPRRCIGSGSVFEQEIGYARAAAEFPATWPVLREACGRIRPAATMIEAGMADPRMRIEIEVEAIIGSARRRQRRSVVMIRS